MRHNTRLITLLFNREENSSMSHLAFPHGDESRLDIPMAMCLLQWNKDKLDLKQQLHSKNRGETHMNQWMP